MAEEEDIYTQDGTINIYRKPANKEKTGNWKACWFILGIRLIFIETMLCELA